MNAPPAAAPVVAPKALTNSAATAPKGRIRRSVSAIRASVPIVSGLPGVIAHGHPEVIPTRAIRRVGTVSMATPHPAVTTAGGVKPSLIPCAPATMHRLLFRAGLQQKALPLNPVLAVKAALP